MRNAPGVRNALWDGWELGQQRSKDGFWKWVTRRSCWSC